MVGTHGDLVPTFYAEWLAIAIGLTVLLPLADRSGAVSVPWIAIGLAALAGVLALQVALGRVAFPERNALGILYMLWAALLACAGARLRERFGLDRVVFALQCALAAAGFLLAIVSLMERFELTVLGLSVAAPGREMLGLLGQRNHVANIVACGFVSLVFLAADRRVRFATHVLAAAPMLVVLALVGSRSACVYMLIGLGCASLDALTGLSGRRSAWRLVALTAVAFVLLGLVATLAHGDAPARIARTFSGGDPERWVLVRYAWAAFLEHPLLGTGWGELAWASLGLASGIGRGLGGAANVQAHNLVLQLAAETGLAGALCIVVPLAAWFVRFPWRTPLRAECWLLVIAAIQLWHGMVEYPQWYAHLLGPFALVLGLGAEGAPEIRLAGARRLVPLAAIAAGAIALASTLADYRALQGWRAAALAHRVQPPELLERLLELRGGLFAPRVEALLALAADPSPAALELSRQALRGYPAPALVRRYAELLDQAGKRAQAEQLRGALAVLDRSAALPATP